MSDISFRRNLRSAASLLAAALEIAGCGWDELDAVAPGAQDTQGLDAQANMQDATDASIGTTDGADASIDDAPPDGEMSSVPCTNEEATIFDWTFDTNVEGWTLSLDTGVKASLVWTGSTGYPSLGAVEVRITPQESEAGTPNGGWLKYGQALGDLTGRTASAWIWLENGASPALKVFAQTGTQYAWADNGTVYLQPRTWTCVSLPISTPSYNQPDYDPTKVVDIGFQLLSSSSFTVYVDTVRIY